MLAVIGFSLASVLLILYAATFENLVVDKLRLPLRSYSAAYYLLAGTFLLWATAAAYDNAATLQAAIVIGDALLLAATLVLLHMITPPLFKQVAVAAGIVVSSWLLLGRMTNFKPLPYFDHGVVVLNTSHTILLITGLLLVFIWLPASMMVAIKITNAKPIPNLYNFLMAIYVGSIFSTLLYLSAHRPIIIVLSFGAICLSACALIASNFYVDRYVVALNKKAKHGK